MPKTEAFLSLPAYWDGIADALGARLSASKKYLRHPATGISAEGYVKDLLREYLPHRYAVETGFIINATGERSPHLDIIVADTFHVPPLCSEPNYKVFAAESVCAVIEVTTSPRGKEKGTPKFEKDIIKLSRVRALCGTREYIDVQPVLINKKVRMVPLTFTLKGSPRCFLVTSGDEWKSANTYERNLVAALRRVNARGTPAWGNASLRLEHGLLTFQADTAYECRWATNKALLRFLLFLNQCVATFPTFKVNIKRYARVLPEA